MLDPAQISLRLPSVQSFTVHLTGSLRSYSDRKELVLELGAAIDRPARRAQGLGRTAVAASVAVVALVTAGIVVLSRSHHGRAQTASPPGRSDVHVPWKAANLRPDTSAITAATKLAAPPGLRQCANTDLRLESGRTAAPATSGGWLKTDFVLRSNAATPCSIRNGFMAVQLLDAAGKELPVDAVPRGAIVFPEALLVKPHQLISGTASWAVYEGRAPRPARLVINPDGRAGAGSEALSVSLAGVAIPPHPRNPSNEGPWRATSYGLINTVIDAGALASLTASITAPATVVIGAILRYSVTVTNPTTATVRLSPCPDFVQRIDVIPIKFPTTVGSRGTLNCDQAPDAITPGDSVTLDYQLDTSAEIPGSGHLTWQLIDGPTAAVSADATMAVTR